MTTAVSAGLCMPVSCSRTDPSAALPTTVAISASSVYDAFFADTTGRQRVQAFAQLNSLSFDHLMDLLKKQPNQRATIDGRPIQSAATNFTGHAAALTELASEYSSVGDYFTKNGVTSQILTAQPSLADVGAAIDYLATQMTVNQVTGLGLLDAAADATMATMDSMWGTGAPLDQLQPIYNSECTDQHNQLITASNNPTIVSQVADRLNSCANTGQPAPSGITCESTASYLKRHGTRTAAAAGLAIGIASIAILSVSATTVAAPIASLVGNAMMIGGTVSNQNLPSGSFTVDNPNYFSDCFARPGETIAKKSQTAAFQSMVVHTLAPSSIPAAQ